MVKQASRIYWVCRVRTACRHLPGSWNVSLLASRVARPPLPLSAGLWPSIDDCGVGHLFSDVVFLYLVRRRGQPSHIGSPIALFRAGMGRNHCCRSLPVKRMDVLCCYVVTYTLAAYSFCKQVTEELMHMERRSAAAAPRECYIGHLRCRKVQNGMPRLHYAVHRCAQM